MPKEMYEFQFPNGIIITSPTLTIETIKQLEEACFGEEIYGIESISTKGETNRYVLHHSSKQGSTWFGGSSTSHSLYFVEEKMLQNDITHHHQLPPVGRYNVVLKENEKERMQFELCRTAMQWLRNEEDARQICDYSYHNHQAFTDFEGNRHEYIDAGLIPHYGIYILKSCIVIVIDVSSQQEAEVISKLYPPAEIRAVSSNKSLGKIAGSVHLLGSTIPYASIARMIHQQYSSHKGNIDLHEPMRIFITGTGWAGSIAHMSAISLRDHLAQLSNNKFKNDKTFPVVKAISFGGPLCCDVTLYQYVTEEQRQQQHFEDLHVTVNINQDIGDRLLFDMQLLSPWSMLPVSNKNSSHSSIADISPEDIFTQAYLKHHSHTLRGNSGDKIISDIDLNRLHTKEEEMLLDFLSVTQNQPATQKWQPLGRYGSCITTHNSNNASNHIEYFVENLTFLPSTKVKYIHDYISHLSNLRGFSKDSVPLFSKESLISASSLHLSKKSSQSSKDTSELLTPTLSSVSLLYQPQRHQVTIQFSGERLDGCQGRFITSNFSDASATATSIDNMRNRANTITKDNLLSAVPFLLHLKEDHTKNLLVPRMHARITSCLTSYDEVIIHIVNCDVQENLLSQESSSAEVVLFTDFGKSNIIDITKNDILKPRNGTGDNNSNGAEKASSSKLNALHPTMNAALLSTALIRIAVYGDYLLGQQLLATSIPRDGSTVKEWVLSKLKEDNVSLWQLWALLLSLETLLLAPQNKSKTPPLTGMSALDRLLGQYWSQRISLAELRNASKVIFTEMSSKVVVAIASDETTAYYLTRKLTGLLGRLGGGVMLSASMLLMIPSALLLAPMSSYIYQQAEEEQINRFNDSVGTYNNDAGASDNATNSNSGGTSSRRGRNNRNNRHIGLNLYVGAAGLLSVPALLVGAMGYYLTTASQYALQDKESLQYKQLLHALLDVIRNTNNNSWKTPTTTSVMRDILDELGPLEDYLVTEFHRLYPEITLSDPHTTTQDIAQVINQHAQEAQANKNNLTNNTNNSALVLQQVFRKTPVLLDKLLMVGQIHAIRTLLQRQLMMGFISNRQDASRHIMHAVFKQSASSSVRDTSSVVKLGSWMSDSSAQQSHKFAEYLEEYSRDSLQLYAVALSPETGNAYTPTSAESLYDADTGLNAKLLAGASMASILIVIVSAASTIPEITHVDSNAHTMSMNVKNNAHSASGFVTSFADEKDLVRVAQAQHRPFLVVLDYFSTDSNRAISPPSPNQFEHIRSMVAEKLEIPESVVLFLTSTASLIGKEYEKNDDDSDEDEKENKLDEAEEEEEEVDVCQLRGMLYGMVHNLLDEAVSPRATAMAALQFLPSSTMHALSDLSSSELQPSSLFSVYHIPELLSQAVQSLLFSLVPLTAEAIWARLEMLAESTTSSSSSGKEEISIKEAWPANPTSQRQHLHRHQHHHHHLHHHPMSQMYNHGLFDLSSTSVVDRLANAEFWSYFYHMANAWEINVEICDLLLDILTIYCDALEQEMLRENGPHQQQALILRGLSTARGNLTIFDALIGSLAMSAVHQLLCNRSNNNKSAAASGTNSSPNPSASTSNRSKNNQKEEKDQQSEEDPTLWKMMSAEDTAQTKTDQMMVDLLLTMNDLVQHWRSEGYAMFVIQEALLKLFATQTPSLFRRRPSQTTEKLDENHIYAIMEETQSMLSLSQFVIDEYSNKDQRRKENHKKRFKDTWLSDIQQYQRTQAQLAQLKALTFPTLHLKETDVASSSSSLSASPALAANSGNNSLSTPLASAISGLGGGGGGGATPIPTSESSSAALKESHEHIKAMKYTHAEIITVNSTNEGSGSSSSSSSSSLAENLLLQLLSLPSSSQEQLYQTEWRFHIAGEAAVDVHGVTRSLVTKVAQEIHANPVKFFLQSNVEESTAGQDTTSSSRDTNDMLYFDPRVCYLCDFVQAYHTSAHHPHESSHAPAWVASMHDPGVLQVVALARHTFRALGRMVGFVLRNVHVGVTLPLQLAPCLYAWLLGKRVGYYDLQLLQPEIVSSLEQIMKMEDVDDLEMTFSVSIPVDIPRKMTDQRRMMVELPLIDHPSVFKTLAKTTKNTNNNNHLSTVGNGGDFPLVTQATRMDYVKSMLQFHLCCLPLTTTTTTSLSLAENWDTTTTRHLTVVEEFVLGVQEMCPRDAWHHLSVRDLQSLVEGDAAIDLVQWRRYTVVQTTASTSLSNMLTQLMLVGGASSESNPSTNSSYNSSNNSSNVTSEVNALVSDKGRHLARDDGVVVEWFWEVVAELSREDQQLLLCFAIGTKTLPAVTGFAGLSPPFTLVIASHVSPVSLPVSHTCFHMLILPRYANKAVLKEKLLLACRETGATHLGLV